MKDSKLENFEFLYRDSDRKNIKLGISRIKNALIKLGEPCLNVPASQIIGTNGKGSITAFLEKILSLSELNFGVTTSPHLLDISERIRVNTKKINKTTFENLLRFNIETLSEFKLTPFELIICCAMQYFDKKKVDLLILEAGLGGRLDATTAHKLSPIIAIGKIGFDHKEYLGETIEEITTEKIAVIEKGSYVVSSTQNKKVEKIIEDKIKEVGAKIFWVKPISENWKIGMDGDFQKENAAVAIGIINLLQKLGWSIKKHTLKKAISETKWPGRLEIIKWQNHKILVDAAHNETAAEVLAKERQYWDKEANGIFWILGVQKNKDIHKIIKLIVKPIDTILLVPVPNHPSWELKDLKFLDKNHNLNIIEFKYFTDALDFLDLNKWPECNPVLTGSIFLVANFMKYVNQIKE